jgi:hypothetical protein
MVFLFLDYFHFPEATLNLTGFARYLAIILLINVKICYTTCFNI